MRDEEIVARIGELVEEEHALERLHTGSEVDDEVAGRIQELAVQLDQCWDLLRHRRARRAAGQDPDEATLRPGAVVESYRQ